MNYIIEDKWDGEWKTLCTSFHKPNATPTKHITTLTKEELVNRVVYVCKRNPVLRERDIGLVARPGASTPKDEYWWVCGINSIC